MWIEGEKKRIRERDRRIIRTRPDGYHAKKNSAHKALHPEKYAARKKTHHMPKRAGYHLHHWSYRTEHAKDVIELTTREHGKAHRFLVYDQERMMYRRSDNMELLDTRQRHEEYIHHMIETRED